VPSHYFPLRVLAALILLRPSFLSALTLSATLDAPSAATAAEALLALAGPAAGASVHSHAGYSESSSATAAWPALVRFVHGNALRGGA